MLRIAGLEVRYGRIAAVRGLDLHVADGETVAVLGPNGAGKTSTLSAIAGLVRPSAGAIELDGASLLGEAPERVVRRGVALVPEGRHIFATLTVAENLLLGAVPRSDRDAVAADVEVMLQRFPVLRRAYRSSAGKLSGGEQQQLAIARALLARPRLLMLDEPSLGLAPRMIDLVFETLAALRETGVTILLVEQNAQRAAAFADRSYVLRSGTLALEGTRETLHDGEALAGAYFG